MSSDKYKIVIIGGSGFIGTRLVKRLINSKKYNITIIDKVLSGTFEDISVKSDVRSKSSLLSSIPDCKCIINLAAEHRDDVRPKSLYTEVNIVGAKNICDVARNRGINTIIFTSSVAVYGYSNHVIDESSDISPFNEYGRTKWEAEKIYKEWHAEDPLNRCLIIVRPTVVFGEQNRGNVYNLFSQIASGKFLMIGNGLNSKSMAYVENVAAFLEHSISFNPNLYTYNYVDKPDLSMNNLISYVNNLLGKPINMKFRLPFFLGILIGFFFDFIGVFTHKKMPISLIRIKKFCSNSVYDSTVSATGFIPPVSLIEGLERTVSFEFTKKSKNQ